MSGGDRDVVHVVYVRTDGDGMAPAFVIDGRDYPDGAAVKAAVAEAWDTLDVRRIAAEFESRPASERPEWLPTWDEYRQQFEAAGEEES